MHIFHSHTLLVLMMSYLCRRRSWAAQINAKPWGASKMNPSDGDSLIERCAGGIIILLRLIESAPTEFKVTDFQSWDGGWSRSSFWGGKFSKLASYREVHWKGMGRCWFSIIILRTSMWNELFMRCSTYLFMFSEYYHTPLIKDRNS